MKSITLKKKSKGINIYNIIILFLLGSAFTMRPTALGQKFSIFAVIIAITAICIYIFFQCEKSVNLLKIRKNFSIFISAFIFWVYCGIQSVIKNSNNVEFSLKAILINLSILFIFTIIMSNEKFNNKFFRLFIIILSLFCISYYITFILSFFIGLDNLYLFKFNIEGYLSSGRVYFPFTIEYNRTYIMDISVIRSMALFREAGIAQMFYLWGFFSGNNYFKNNKAIRLIMFLGVISCFSTTGFITFIVVYSIEILLKLKKINIKVLVSIIILAVSCMMFINTKGISIKDKDPDSINDRTYVIKTSLDILSENPIFGIGFYNGDNNSQLGINFISSTHMFGIVGILLYSMIFFVSFIKSKCYTKFIIGISPIIITLLFAQPLIDSPLIYILLLANYE